MDVFKQQFGDPYKIKKFGKKFLGINQRGSIQNYNTQFDEYVSLLHWNDEIFMTVYTNDLKEDVQQGILIREKQCDI